MHSHQNRTIKSRPHLARKIKQRALFALALIGGVIVAGVASLREADAGSIQAVNDFSVTGPSHMVALVLLVLLFFATAGLAGAFWHHLAESQKPKDKKY